jgi:hypothetical protein
VLIIASATLDIETRLVRAGIERDEMLWGRAICAIFERNNTVTLAMRRAG